MDIISSGKKKIVVGKKLTEEEKKEKENELSEKRRTSRKFIETKIQDKHRSYIMFGDGVVFIRKIFMKEIWFDSIPMSEPEKVIPMVNDYIEDFDRIEKEIQEQELYEHEIWRAKNPETEKGKQQADQWRRRLNITA